LGIGDWRLGIGDWRLEIGNRRLGIGDDVVISLKNIITKTAYNFNISNK